MPGGDIQQHPQGRRCAQYVAMVILKNLSGRIREKTSDYIDVLKFASDYVKLNSSELAKTENWKEMMALASYYNLLQTQPYMMH